MLHPQSQSFVRNLSLKRISIWPMTPLDWEISSGWSGKGPMHKDPNICTPAQFNGPLAKIDSILRLRLSLIGFRVHCYDSLSYISFSIDYYYYERSPRATITLWRLSYQYEKSTTLFLTLFISIAPLMGPSFLSNSFFASKYYI